MPSLKGITLLLALGLLVLSGLLAGWGIPTPSLLHTTQPAAQRAPAPLISEIIAQVSLHEFRDLVEGLSGEKPVTVGGQQVTFTTRYTSSPLGTLAEQYIYDYFRSLGLPAAYHEWVGQTESGTGRCSNLRGRNVVAEIPGSLDPARIYIIGGHLDSISPTPDSSAPGADDNASGIAAVMQAARVLRSYTPAYTLRFVAFTGEEHGLCGSNRYAHDARARNEDIRGVINLDMIAYDSDGAKSIELNTGSRADAQELAGLVVQMIDTYNLNLDPKVADFGVRSDHASFWRYNYPAIHASEHLFSPDGDMNPHYHSVVCCDRLEHMDLGMGVDLTRAALATFATLGEVRPGSSLGQVPPPQPTADLPSPVPTSVGVSAPAPVPTVAPTTVPTVALPGSRRYLFAETGKTVSGLFLDYWEQNGGLARQGYPISDLLGEVSPLDGKPYTVQYFERAVFEYHPENRPPYNVLLSQLGTFQFKKKYPRGEPASTVAPDPAARLFPETGKRVGGTFLQYWQRNGGLAQFGYPISNPFIERSDLDGKEYLVQYFERAVFELHPENQPPYDVLLSQLGTFRYKEKYSR